MIQYDCDISKLWYIIIYTYYMHATCMIIIDAMSIYIYMIIYVRIFIIFYHRSISQILNVYVDPGTTK